MQEYAARAARDEVRLALGLMSGTSLDGIDAALLWTDGRASVRTGAFLSMPYDDVLRDALRSILGGKGPVAEVERTLTEAHAVVVQRLLAREGIDSADVAVIGIAVNTPADEAEQAAAAAGAKFPQLIDADGAAFAQIGENALPRVYVLDAQRRIAWFDIEYSESTRRELQQTLTALAGEQR